MKELAELTGKAATTAHPGTVAAHPTLKEAAALAAGGPGDKVEAHTSEEELGVTTPLNTKEAAQ